MTQLPPDYPKDALPPDSQLNGYTIKSVLGRGTFGITYLAEETQLERLVAIKEFLPEMAATREDGSQVVAKPGNMGMLFHQELANFLEEAKTLVKFNHPNVVRVLTYFPALGTAYLVMEYEFGMDLNQYLEENPNPSEQTLIAIFSPIVQGLAAVHSSGYIHRDIKAGNIYMREDNSPVLLDFGAARNVINSDVNQLTRILTVGYAPYEQDNPSWAEQGPWTDIYALAATLYFCILAKKPISSTARAGAIFGGQEDPIESIMALRPAGYSLNFLAAIDKALRFEPEERPQTALEWDAMLNAVDADADKTVFAGADFNADLSREEATASQAMSFLSSESAKPKRSKLIPSVMVFAGLGIAAYLFVPSFLPTTNLADQSSDVAQIDKPQLDTPIAEPVVVQSEQPLPTGKTEITDLIESSAPKPDKLAQELALKEEKARQAAQAKLEENARLEKLAQEEALLTATMEQSSSTVLSSLLLGKTAVWHFARGEKISDLIEQIKSLPATTDRTRFIVDQENKKRESDDGFNANFNDYQASIEKLRLLSQPDIDTALAKLFTQPRYAEDQTYRVLSELIKKHASSEDADPNAIRTDLIELSRSNAFVES